MEPAPCWMPAWFTVTELPIHRALSCMAGPRGLTGRNEEAMCPVYKRTGCVAKSSFVLVCGEEVMGQYQLLATKGRRAEATRTLSTELSPRAFIQGESLAITADS